MSLMSVGHLHHSVWMSRMAVARFVPSGIQALLTNTMPLLLRLQSASRRPESEMRRSLRLLKFARPVR